MRMNSIVRRSVAVAGVTLFMSGLLSGGASAGGAVAGGGEALPQLECRGEAYEPEQDGDNVRARAETTCRKPSADVIGVRVWLQKYDDGEWETVAEDSDRKEHRRYVEATAEDRCEEGWYRTVSVHYARRDDDRYRDRDTSERVRVDCDKA
jgi:hypothetical protein